MFKAIIGMDAGDVVIELFDEAAPNTVANFVSLARKGFYDGLTFHRVIPGAISQGGCPRGDGTGGPGYTIKCETEGNPHRHVTGSVAMAHAGRDTGGSQFFIVHAAQPHLDGVHTVFGKVVEGISIVLGMRQGDVMQRVSVVEQ